MSQRWTYSQVEKTESTNDLARSMPLWSAVRADQQSRGRGRRGNTWESPLGGLWASYVIPSFPHPMPSVAVGATLVTELRALTGIESIRLKFPNDLYIGCAKLGGILIESPDSDRWIVGIGINVSNSLQPDPSQPYPRTSLAAEISSPPDIETLSQAIGPWLAGAPATAATITSAWGEDALEVAVTTQSTEISGHFLGMSPHGKLIIKLPNGALQEIPGTEVCNYREIHKPT